MEIKKIKYELVTPYAKMGKRERVTFENPDNAHWYGIFKGEKLIAFYCLVGYKNSVRFKSNYTLPAYRRNGCLQQFIEHAKMKCRQWGMKTMSAFCTPMSISSHLKHGAQPCSENNGIVFVRYTI